MIKQEIAPGIVIYSDVIPNSSNLHNDIEEGIISARLEWSAASVKEGDDNHVNTMSRDTSTLGIEYYGELINNFENTQLSFYSTLNNLFFENFDKVEKDYKSDFGIATTWHDSYGLLKYGSGQKFTNHIDDHVDYHRRISTVYYINDDYLGGEINFPRFGITFKPKANQMIVFPSTYVYNHSVSPVIEGTRYAVVSWLK
jgi:Rps23 Pro-64 3,4-dihydroxylase Tpa1-like proline 4-hydroxylase